MGKKTGNVVAFRDATKHAFGLTQTPSAQCSPIGDTLRDVIKAHPVNLGDAAASGTLAIADVKREGRQNG